MSAQAAAETLTKPRTCEWRENDSGEWYAGCRLIVAVIGMISPRWKFCPYCGGSILVVPWKDGAR